MSELKLKAAAWAKLKAVRTLNGLSAPTGYASRKSADIDAEANAIDKNLYSEKSQAYEQTNLARFASSKTFSNVLSGRSHDAREVAKFNAVITPVPKSEHSLAVVRDAKAVTEVSSEIIRLTRESKKATDEERSLYERAIKEAEQRLPKNVKKLQKQYEKSEDEFYRKLDADLKAEEARIAKLTKKELESEHIEFDKQTKRESAEMFARSEEASRQRNIKSDEHRKLAINIIGEEAWKKLSDDEHANLTIKEEIKESVVEFSNNPIADKKVKLTYGNIMPLTVVEALELVKLHPKFTLVVKIGKKLLLVSKNISADGVTYKLDPKSEKYNELKKSLETGAAADATSDAPDQTADLGPGVYLIWWPIVDAKKKPAGAYFKYYHKLAKVDMRRYGIYQNLGETDGYKKNCLEMALEAAGIPEGDLQNLMPMLRTRNVPQSQLKEVADFLKIYIVLTKVYDKRKSFKYGNPTYKRVDIGLVDDHYFIIESTVVNSYPIINYFTENLETVDRDFGLIYKKEGNKFKRANRAIDSLKLIELLLEHKDTHLTPITLSNCGLYTNFGARTIDYIDLPDVVYKKDKESTEDDRDAKLVQSRELAPPRIFKAEENEKNTRYLPYEVIFFDTETTTDGEIHEPYLCRSVTRGSNEKRVFRGENCALKWLKSLKTHALLIAHNLRYDFQFMLRFLTGVRDIIQSGSHVRAVSGTFHNKYTGNTINLAFKDSLSVITMPLRDFGKCFKLECEKDVMPYRSYTRESVTNEYASIDDAIKYICEDNHSFDSADIFADVKAFCKNIKKWNLESADGLYFKHMEYSDIYCEKDCDVLAAGYDKFRGWIQEMTTVRDDADVITKLGLDIDFAVSLPQIADAYGVRSGVFDGCFKLSGVARDFIQRSVVGGRCMTRRNEKFKISHRGNDNDGVSLYPSAMSRMSGYLKGVPKVIRDPTMIANIEQGLFGGIDGVFVEIEILSVGVRRDFPLMSYRSDEGVRVFTNDMVGRHMYVDMTTLQDLKEFQQVTYKVIRGYYFNDGRNTKINEFMRGLFNERLIKKKEGNPVEVVYKLLMNSFYGKQIQKPIESDTEFIYGKEEMQKAAHYNYNFIKSIIEISNGMYVVNKARSINNHFSMPHCGSEVLSISKRIMNEVMCLAEDNAIEIYYQDTDSMHIDDRSIYGADAVLTGSEHLANLFRDKYEREMTGKHLGQFHCDFNGDSDVTVYSAESVFLGKKSYFDKLVFEQCVPLPGETRKACKARVSKLPKEEFNKIPRTISYGAHMRMKGSPAKCLHEVAAARYEGDVHKMYLGMLEGDAITVDMLSVCKFKTNKDFTTSSNKEFKRTLKF